MRLDQMGLAVGFFTNGTIKGAGISRIAAGRGTHQLTTILEILCRIQMRSQGAPPSLMQQFRGLQRGASWAYFCYQHGKTTEEVATYARAFKTPLVQFIWQLASAPSNDPDGALSDMVRIKDIHLDHVETV